MPSNTSEYMTYCLFCGLSSHTEAVMVSLGPRQSNIMMSRLINPLPLQCVRTFKVF